VGHVKKKHKNDIFYSLVVIWALAGIFIKRIADTSVADNLVVISVKKNLHWLAFVLVLAFLNLKH